MATQKISKREQRRAGIRRDANPDKPFRMRIGNKQRVNWVWEDDVMVPVRGRRGRDS